MFGLRLDAVRARINAVLSHVTVNMRLYMCFFLRKPRAIEWNPMNFASKYVRLGFFAVLLCIKYCGSAFYVTKWQAYECAAACICAVKSNKEHSLIRNEQQH